MPDTDATKIPFARTLNRAAAITEKFNTPIGRMLGSATRWVILAALAVSVYAGKQWIAETIAKSPAVVEARAAAIDAKLAVIEAKGVANEAKTAAVDAKTAAGEARATAATANDKADDLTAGQTRLTDLLRENLAERKATREAVTSLTSAVAVVATKVEDAQRQNAADIQRIDGRLNAIQQQAAGRPD